MTAHAYLRVATRAAHDQVDALLSGYDLASRDNYTRFLQAQAAAFLPVEQALEQAGVEELIPDWSDRRRSAYLLEDLAALGVSGNAVAAPDFVTKEAIIGGVYVLEGSRLGGAMLARSVGSAFPSRFLSGPSPSGGWKAVLALLEHNLRSIIERKQAAQSAIETFGCFSRAASVSVGNQ